MARAERYQKQVCLFSLFSFFLFLPRSSSGFICPGCSGKCSHIFCSLSPSRVHAYTHTHTCTPPPTYRYTTRTPPPNPSPHPHSPHTESDTFSFLFFFFLSPFLSFSLLPAVGTEDAEVSGTPSVENPELRKILPLEPWSVSEYSHACFAHCQEFLPCFNVCASWSIHLYFFKTLSLLFALLLQLTQFPYWEPTE